MRGTLGDIDPLNKVPFQRAISRVKKDPLQGVSLILPRTINRELPARGLIQGRVDAEYLRKKISISCKTVRHTGV